MISKHRKHEQGFNLVEVLIAMAVTAVVILSVATLFFLGRQNVYSGKQMSSAVAVATRVTEDLSKMGRDNVYANFGLGTESLSSNTVMGKAYASSVLRKTTTDAGSATKDPFGFLTNWKSLMDTTNFVNGKITLIFMPRLTTTAPVDDLAPNTPTSTLLQVRAILEWDEGLRHRSLILDVVKTVRR